MRLRGKEKRTPSDCVNMQPNTPTLGKLGCSKYGVEPAVTVITTTSLMLLLLLLGSEAREKREEEQGKQHKGKSHENGHDVTLLHGKVGVGCGKDET
jgi:uncharacterized protein